MNAFSQTSVKTVELPALQAAKKVFNERRNPFIDAKIHLLGEVSEDVQAKALTATNQAFTVTDPDFLLPISLLKQRSPDTANRIAVPMWSLGLYGDVHIGQRPEGVIVIAIVNLTTGACPRREDIKKGVSSVTTECLENAGLKVMGVQASTQFEWYVATRFKQDATRKNEILQKYADRNLKGEEALAFIESVLAESVQKGYATLNESRFYKQQRLVSQSGWIPETALPDLEFVYDLASQHADAVAAINKSVEHLEPSVILGREYRAKLSAGEFSHAPGEDAHVLEATEWFLKRKDEVFPSKK